MFWNKCKHPFNSLVVEKPVSSYQEPSELEFETVEMYFSCGCCGQLLTKKYAKLIHGVEGFMENKNA